MKIFVFKIQNNTTPKSYTERKDQLTTPEPKPLSSPKVDNNKRTNLDSSPKIENKEEDSDKTSENIRQVP